MFKIFIILSSVLFTSLFANPKKICNEKGDNYIFVKGECINYKTFLGDSEGLNIIVHGTWDEGTDILARYTSFAEDVALKSDVTTIVVALPGYSDSTSNKLKAIGSKEYKNLAATKEYVEFFALLVEELKKEFESSYTTIIAHSAGCMLSATSLGFKKDLVDNLLCAGGVYDIHKKTDKKDLISAVDVINKISKDTKIVIVYGTKDTVSTPKMNKDFYEIAKKKGLNVKLVEAKDVPHMELEMTKSSMEAIEDFFE